MTGDKECKRCGITKSVLDFAKDGKRTDGRSFWCKACKKAHNVERKAKMSKEITSKPCIICKTDKPFTEYHVNSSGKFGFHNECKACRKEKRSKSNFIRQKSGIKKCSRCEKIRPISKFNSDKYMSDGVQTCCKRCQMYKNRMFKSTLDGCITSLLLDARFNAKKRKNCSFNLTPADVMTLCEKQDMVCPYYGVKMTTNKNRTLSKYKMGMNISIDRINSDIGYEPGNIQIISAMANVRKYNYPEKACLFAAELESRALKKELEIDVSSMTDAELQNELLNIIAEEHVDDSKFHYLEADSEDVSVFLSIDSDTDDELDTDADTDPELYQPILPSIEIP